jgi:hypothetical protein
MDFQFDVFWGVPRQRNLFFFSPARIPGKALVGSDHRVAGDQRERGFAHSPHPPLTNDGSFLSHAIFFALARNGRFVESRANPLPLLKSGSTGRKRNGTGSCSRKNRKEIAFSFSNKALSCGGKIHVFWIHILPRTKDGNGVPSGRAVIFKRRFLH